jgi:esterase
MISSIAGTLECKRAGGDAGFEPPGNRSGGIGRFGNMEFGHPSYYMNMSVDLVFSRVDGERPEDSIAFLHGILGRGWNLRNIARRLVEARPGWTAWLLDLRGHGESPKGAPSPSLEAAARDVVEFATKVHPPLRAIVGHSFGGKVALEAARIGVKSLEHVVVIDSMPGARVPFRGGDSALGVMNLIESLSETFASKMEFVRAVTAAGLGRSVAEWLAQSVVREGDHVRFGLDLKEVRGFVMDYFARDLWPVVENPPDELQVHLLIAEQSESFSAADRKRALGIAESNKRVTVDVLPGGHWLHVDNPKGLLTKLLEWL